MALRRSLCQRAYEAQQRLKRAGVRLTAQRRAIIAAALCADGHFDADELWYNLRRQGRNVSRATVYRTLALLMREGLLRKVPLGTDHAHYEPIRGDAHHEHLVCTKCGRVIEFVSPALERAIARACEEHGFEAAGHRVEVTGICSQCAATRSKERSAKESSGVGQRRRGNDK